MGSSVNSECLGMSTFFRGISEAIPSLVFCGIFSERNSVANSIQYSLGEMVFINISTYGGGQIRI